MSLRDIKRSNNWIEWRRTVTAFSFCFILFSSFDSISYTFRLSDPWLYVKPSIGEGRDRDKEKRDMGSSQLSQAFIVLLLLCVIPALPKLLYRLINNHFQSSVSVSIQINNMHKSKLDLRYHGQIIFKNFNK